MNAAFNCLYKMAKVLLLVQLVAGGPRLFEGSIGYAGSNCVAK